MAPFEFAVKNGFEAFEWFPDKKITGEGWLLSDITKEIRSSIYQTAAAKNMRLSVHAPWQSNPTMPDGTASLKDAVAFGVDIGASLLNIHLNSDKPYAALTELLRPLLALTAEAGIDLSVENTVLTSPSDFNLFFSQLHTLPSGEISHVGMCLDIGHANLCAETRNDYLRFLDMLDEKIPIIHLHMHENYGDHDSHLTIFTGPAGRNASGIEGLIDRLKRRRFSGSIILEQWPEPQSLLIEARERLIQIIQGKADLPEIMPAGPGVHEGIAGMFVSANSKFTSWRTRLEWVSTLLESHEALDRDLLVYIAIYLKFLGTGAINCTEEGGHHRPSHHSKLAEYIYGRLCEIENAENSLVIRKIYPWLPSFDTEFMRAEPLTRIRDIAHRNDIPQELKQEIKTTLQNKLHRSAGPEDLVTSEALLKRITSPGASYPEPFVEEFKRFHKELKDFFNAGSLKDMLLTLKDKGDIDTPELVDDVLAIVGRSGEKKAYPDQVIKELDLLTSLRRSLARSDNVASAKTHRLKIVDIRLEDHCFALMSTIINLMASSKDLPWKKALPALSLSVENLRLGGFDPEECRAIDSELGVWAADFDPKDRDCLLRLKATVDRCRRLAGQYADKILALFPDKVSDLGHALGVSEHSVKVFAEADIRSHPVFQLSKLASLLTGSIKALAFLMPWDVIVPGESSGRLAVAKTLTSLTYADNEPMIVLTDAAEGDEEIPPQVTGLIIAGETPLLSHLAVRARQKGIVFVSCEDVNRIEQIKRLAGKLIKISVYADTFEISEAKIRSKDVVKARAPQVMIPEISLGFPFQVSIPIDEVTSSTGGAKAYTTRRLKEISKLGNTGFEVPLCRIIPFGVMEQSLHSMPSLEAEYYEALKKLDRLPHADMATQLQRIRDVVMKLHVDDKLLSGVMSVFQKDDLLIVRSSSNCEDLEGFAGAGLYDSILNVPQSELDSAVLKVWASLWNRRAAEARRNASIPHEKSRMAVIIQKIMPSELSFIMHTVNPINNNENELLFESAAGLGETLASGREPGAPFRTIYRKDTGDIVTLSFANYSAALYQNRGGGTMRNIIDYSRVPFSRDKNFRTTLSVRIGAVGRQVESSFGMALDIEGLVAGDKIYLVQARPQQGRRK